MQLKPLWKLRAWNSKIPTVPSNVVKPENWFGKQMV